MTELPTYAEARSECLENDNPSCLAWFITEHEGGRPGSLEEQTFRADLHAAIEEAKDQGFREAEGMFDQWRKSNAEIVAMQFPNELWIAGATGFLCGAFFIAVAIYMFEAWS